MSINPKAYNLYLSGKRYQRQFFDGGDTLYNELAYRQFREALELEPDFANAMVGLAWAYNSKSYYGSKSHLYNDSALLYIDHAIDINPNLSESYVFLGFFYRYGQEDVDKSINAFKMAAELNPNDFYSLGIIGESYIDEKKFDMASEYLIKAFKINHSDVVPGYENANELHISNFIGRLMCDAGMFKEAEQFERQLLEYYPDKSHGFLGHVSLRQGKFKEANKAYKYEYEKDTSNNIFLHWLAESYYYLNHFDSAEFYFRKLEKRFQENPGLEIDFLITYRARLAYALILQGKEVEAKRYLLQHIDKLKSMNDPSRWAYDIAYAYAYQGNVKESVKYLKKMDFWWVTYGLIKVDPMFNPIRGEPEFQQELYRMESEMMELRDELMIGRFEEELSWYFEK
jgi:tetratricopeptide (TPR) repeat protein